tara:strand:- start:464 stop:892 length:429 start_codon:yes stop_codon:yes gene_type:complete
MDIKDLVKLMANQNYSDSSLQAIHDILGQGPYTGEFSNMVGAGPASPSHNVHEAIDSEIARNQRMDTYRKYGDRINNLIDHLIPELMKDRLSQTFDDMSAFGRGYSELKQEDPNVLMNALLHTLAPGGQAMKAIGMRFFDED